MNKEIKILEYKKNDFLEKVAKFNKKANKLGVAPMVVEFGEETVHSFYASETNQILGILSKVVYLNVNVNYEIPKLNGWELVSVFDCESYKDEETEETKTVVFTATVPGKELPFKYQDKTEIHCEHCGHNRFRVKSYLVVHESGEYKEVGSTCLKDFLGHDPSGFMFAASYETIIKELDDEFGGGMGGTNTHAFSLLGTLALTEAMIKKNGWTSRTQVYESDGYSGIYATADQVLDYLFKKDKSEYEKIEVTDEDREIASKTVEYFKSLDTQDNDYIMNCMKVVKIDRIPYAKMGIACSMIQSYRKHVEKTLKVENELPSEWVGEVGSKLQNLNVTCTFKTYVESYYGTSTLYKFVEDNGNVFKTFYSGGSWTVEQGDRVVLKGTVKKHDEWNGKKETLLTRCNVR